MGLTTIPQPKEEKSSLPFLITRKVAEPIMIASQKFYRTNPKETLEYVLTAVFLLLTFGGELFGNLPFFWYIVFGLWIIYQYKFNQLKRKKKYGK